MKKYLISGIPPSHGGVGYLMYILVELAVTNRYEVVMPKRVNKSVKKSFNNTCNLLKEFYKRKRTVSSFKKEISTIKNSEIILIHPQTIGYKDFIALIKNNNIVKVYVMDNSFFCINSYNVLDNKECLKCLGNLNNCDEKCQAFPVKYKKDDNLTCLKELQRYSKKILFYAQNDSQSKLLKVHFGENTNIKVIGMKTNEIIQEKNTIEKTISYDIVYHGSVHEAKGIHYLIDLARKLPKYLFFVPSVLSFKNLPQNIIHRNMTWNNGLKEIIASARLVMNPSLWSAPIEGALLKSIYYNGNVAVVKTDYGYINDIPNDVLLKLSSSTSVASREIEIFFKEKLSLKKESSIWIKYFFSDYCNLNLLYEEVIYG